MDIEKRSCGDFSKIANYTIFNTLKYRIEDSLRKMSDTAKKEVI
jgi:hypothetical protein